MAKVIAFPEAKTPMLRGPARCLGCGACWEAVVPEGTIVGFACPQCHLYKGVFEGVCEPEGGCRWVCDCGSDIYYILSYGCQCVMCGVIQKGF